MAYSNSAKPSPLPIRAPVAASTATDPTTTRSHATSASRVMGTPRLATPALVVAWRRMSSSSSAGTRRLERRLKNPGAQSRLRRRRCLPLREDQAADLLLGGVGVDFDARRVAEEVEGGEAVGGGVGADEVGDRVVHGPRETGDVFGLHGVPDALADGPSPGAARLERGGRGVDLAGGGRGRRGALHVGHRRGVQRQALGVVRRLVEGRVGGRVVTGRRGGCRVMRTTMAREEAERRAGGGGRGKGRARAAAAPPANPERKAGGGTPADRVATQARMGDAAPSAANSGVGDVSLHTHRSRGAIDDSAQRRPSCCVLPVTSKSGRPRHLWARHGDKLVSRAVLE